MTEITDHDSYIAAAPERFRPILEHTREVLRSALPEAEEMVAYGMPGFRWNGAVVASYAAFSKQLGVYFHGEALSVHADEIGQAGRKATKTGITFPPTRPLPDELLTRLARTSLECNRGEQNR